MVTSRYCSCAGRGQVTMVTIKRIILLSPFVIPTGLFVDTCFQAHIASRGKPAAGHGSAEPCTPCLRSCGDPLLPLWILGWVFWVFLGGYPNQKWLQLPGLGREGSGTPQAQGKLVGTKRKKRNLPPNCWILMGSSSLPILPAKPKGVRQLLARNLGLTASTELCKASSRL